MLDFPLTEDDTELLSAYLSLSTKYKVFVKIPERGDGRALCDMARKNAMESARQHRLEGEREDKNLARLKTLLSLPELPRRIEAYDISNIGDENIVASMVVSENGKLKRSEYRSFKINTTGGRDDYASMKEALARRLAHIGDGDASFGNAPDLILLDGGKTHVGAIRPLLKAMDIDVPVFGMVKDDYHKTRAMTDGESEISIAHSTGVYAFVFAIQEEAHRFAYKNSQSAKRKTLTHSSLEKISGIGPKKAKLLLAAMSLSEIRTASAEDLAKVKGISSSDAENIHEYYARKGVKNGVKNNNRRGKGQGAENP
jgi:excinuclease ABC subunit C